MVGGRAYINTEFESLISLMHCNRIVQGVLRYSLFLNTASWLNHVSRGIYLHSTSRARLGENLIFNFTARKENCFDDWEPSDRGPNSAISGTDNAITGQLLNLTTIHQSLWLGGWE